LGRLTLRSPPTDGLRARHRLEAALNQADWCPPGLPATGLLVVRRIALDTDQSIAVEGGAFAPHVTAAVRRAAEAARRPWLHADAGSSPAVLFWDETELIACLVRDWARDSHTTGWWWRYVLGDVSAAQWLREHVLLRGDVLVPALARLASAQAAAFLARVDDQEIERAIEAVRRAYALSPPAPQPRVPVRSRHTQDARRVPRTAFTRSGERGGRAALDRLVVTVPEAFATSLRPRQRHLFAMALALIRAPSWARSSEFMAALEMLEGNDMTAVARTNARAEAPHRRATSRRGRRAPDPCCAPRSRSVPEGAPNRAGSNPRDSRSRRPPPQTGAERAADLGRVDRPVRSQARTIEEVSGSRTDDARDGIASSRSHSQPSESKTVPVAREASTTPFDIGAVPAVHTQFGGIFYLLNAAIALELYGDFTAPRAPGLALSPWDWLALTGQRWFGEPFEHDPVWKVLAALAGRDAHDAPGHEFAAPGQWAVAESWLAPWGRVAQVMYHATPRRLRLLHPAGYTLLDGPRDSRRTPAQQARAWCHARASLRGAALRRSSNVPRSSRARTPTARWMGWLLGYLQARLARSLGVAPDIDVPTLVCRHDADVVCSITSVDVSLSLAALPLPLRVAGLDRDPGWIPAAGRAIAFHFE